MKHYHRYRCLILVVGWLGLGLVQTGVAQVATESSAASGSGVITGRVSNASTSDYLEGASVTLAGTNRSAVTDYEGRYVITGVPPTQQGTLVVRYSGLDVQSIPVSLASGQRLVQDVALQSEIYRMERFTVAGEREGMAKAEVLQRLAPNVKTVISSDAFGNVANGDIAEMLQQVAGVSTAYNGPEARGVSMRGIQAQLNSVTVNGQSIAQSSGASTERRFDFDQETLNNIESIEITKAPTPDMEGASVGGSVNLVTKTPFDRAGGRFFTYTVGLTTNRYTKFEAVRWKEPISGFGPTLAFNYSDVFGAKRNFGITLNGSFNSNQLTNGTLLKQYELKAEPGPLYVNQIGTTFSSINRSRFGSGISLAYRLSDSTTLTLNTSYNWTHKTDNNPRMTLTAARTLATLDASGNRTGGGPINPNYADGITRVFPVAANNVVLNDITSHRSGPGFLLQPMVRHRFDHGLEIDYSVAHSGSDIYLESGVPNRMNARPMGTSTVTLTNIGWTVDRSQDVLRPTVRQTAGPDWTNLNNYTGLQLSQGITTVFERITNARFDAKKALAFRPGTYVKTGLAYKRQSRDRESTSPVYRYTGQDGVFGNADDNRDIAQFLDTTSSHLNSRHFKREYQDSGLTAPFLNTFAVARHKEDNPGLWNEVAATTLQNKLLSLRQITETIGAAYLMAGTKFGPLSAMAGLRVEETRDKGVGPLNYISPEERARRAAWVGPVTDQETLRRVEAQYGNRRTNEGKYTNVFPGIHFKYEPIDGMLVRASWARGVGRPGWGSIIPLDTANDDNQTVNASNPELKPQLADSMDVTAEYYFRNGGLLSAGVFRKVIDDYIYTDNTYIIPDGPDNGYDGQYAGYRLTTQRNRGSATVEGVEANYQQQLTFLPGWARGFGLNVNFTALQTEGDYGTGVKSTTGLPQFINRTGTFAVNYRGYGFNLRMQSSYRSRYLQADNANPALVQWRKPALTWNWQSKYTLTKNLSLFFDIQNVFWESVADIYVAHEDRSANFQVHNPRYSAGVMGRF